MGDVLKAQIRDRAESTEALAMHRPLTFLLLIFVAQHMYSDSLTITDYFPSARPTTK